MQYFRHGFYGNDIWFDPHPYSLGPHSSITRLVTHNIFLAMRSHTLAVMMNCPTQRTLYGLKLKLNFSSTILTFIKWKSFNLYDADTWKMSEWLTGEDSFSYWLVLPLLIIFMINRGRPNKYILTYEKESSLFNHSFIF